MQSHAIQFKPEFVAQKRYARLAARERVVRAAQSWNASPRRLYTILGAREDVMKVRVGLRRRAVFDGPFRSSARSAWVDELNAIIE